MKVKMWAIFQAEAMNFCGIKVARTNSLCPIMCMFPDKEFAENYLANVITRVKQGIEGGQRTVDNLDPTKKLDFLIAEVWVQLPFEQIEKKGWKIDFNWIKERAEAHIKGKGGAIAALWASGVDPYGGY